MNFKELAELVKSGVKPVVTMGKKIDDHETYAEPGMRGRLVGAQMESHDDVIKLFVDYSEFDEFNKGFESANYFNREQVPCLTAREAGYYNPQDHIYVDTNRSIEGVMEVVEGEALSLFAEYNASSKAVSYTQWLETEVLKLRSGN